MYSGTKMEKNGPISYFTEIIFYMALYTSKQEL